jgi:hypothetical protein
MLVPADCESLEAENPALTPAHEEVNLTRTRDETLAHMGEGLARINGDIACTNASMHKDIARINQGIDLVREMVDSLLASRLIPDLLHSVRLISYHFAVEYKKESRDLSTTPSIAEVAEEARKDPASLVGVAFAAFSNSPEFADFKHEAMINLVKAVDRACVGKTYSNNMLMRWLSKDGSYCARLLKSELPGHDEAIDKLLAMTSALRTSIMSSNPPWRCGDDETDSYSD